MRVFHRAEHRLLLEIARVTRLRAFFDKLLEKTIAVFEAARLHVLGGPHGAGRVLRYRQIERTVLAAKKACRGESFELFRLAVAFDLLPDIDERRNHRISRSQNFGHPRADMRGRDRLRGDVARVPMVLMTRMQDMSQIGQHVGTDRYRWSLRYPDEAVEIIADYRLRSGEGILDIAHRQPPATIGE
jgi:hypothetical protein